MEKTIGLLTTFANFDPGYSLTSVVRDQLTVLQKYGYKTVLFVLPSFMDDILVPHGIEIRKVVPQIILEPYKELGYPDHWKEDVTKVVKSLNANFQDITHLICHDIFFIDTYLPYNLALRDTLGTLQEMKILAWTHSAPSERPFLENNPHVNRYTLNDPRLTLVYLNHDKALNLAEMYGGWLKDVRIVHNARDLRTFLTLHPLVESLITKYDLCDADIVSVYPVSTPRMISGKGLDKVIKLHSMFKKHGYKTRLIVPNAHANASRDQRLIQDTKIFASDRGITHEELIFTSLEGEPEIGENYILGVPPQVISELFRIASIFIFPTVSENSSLVLLEAMLSGNLCVLNQAVGTLREHAGDRALYFDFSYRPTEVENDRYYSDLARIVEVEFENDRSLQLKRRALQRHNYDFMFKKELEPLLYA